MQDGLSNISKAVGGKALLGWLSFYHRGLGSGHFVLFFFTNPYIQEIVSSCCQCIFDHYSE